MRLPRLKIALTLSGVLLAATSLAPIAEAGLFDRKDNVKLAPQERSAIPLHPISFADLAEELLPTVVNISSTVKPQSAPELNEVMPHFPENSPFGDFFEHFMERRGNNMQPSMPVGSLGSGFVIDAEKGYIVTNSHVVKDAEKIRVTLHNDITADAKIIGRDDKTDLAVLQIETKNHQLQAAKFGNSDDMRVGDWILAIGNPFGLGGTVTSGIISARARDINSGPYDDYLQTDASINRGNSGGPMFNLQGEVIGINTAIFSPTGGSVGIGFAIPSAMTKGVVDQLIEYGHTRRGWLGVRIQTVTEEIAESLGLDEARGALVSSISENSPAGKAKVESGDIILQFNGQEVREMRELPRIVAATDIDKKIDMVVLRDGKEKILKVKVGELEKAEKNGLVDEAQKSEAQPEIDVGDAIAEIGISTTVLSDDIRDEYGIEDRIKGVLILDTDTNSEAAKEGIVPGDVISEVNQQPVSDSADIRKAIKTAKAKKRGFVLLLINRDNDIRFVAIKIDTKK